MDKGFEDAIEFFAFSPLIPDEDERQSGCSSCLSMIVGLIFVMCMFQSCFASFGTSFYNSYDPVYEAYKGGEPDYADGDLEDKLGDSGYYYDLFPEERDGESDDYVRKNNSQSSGSSKKYSSNFDVNDDFIRNMRDIRTRQFRVIGAINVNGKIYYKNDDGTYHRGWKEELGSWYYFDPETLALVCSALKDIDGKVYYFNEYGQMVTNSIIEIAGIKIAIDNNGWCTAITE